MSWCRRYPNNMHELASTTTNVMKSVGSLLGSHYRPSLLIQPSADQSPHRALLSLITGESRSGEERERERKKKGGRRGKKNKKRTEGEKGAVPAAVLLLPMRWTGAVVFRGVEHHLPGRTWATWEWGMQPNR